MRLLPTRLLNPNPFVSVKGAARIAPVELRSRRYELPPPGEEVLVCELGSETAEAIAWLSANGYRAEATSKFAEGEDEDCYRLWEPNPLVVEMIEALPPGVALDVGCGTGRNAVYLASEGWAVSAFDHLPDAIEKAKELEDLYMDRRGIKWQVRRADEPLDRTFDLITAFFFYDEGFYRRARALLNPHGWFVAEAFAKAAGSPKNAPTTDEFRALMKEFDEVLLRPSKTQDGRETIQLIATLTQDLETSRLDLCK